MSTGAARPRSRCGIRRSTYRGRSHRPSLRQIRAQLRVLRIVRVLLLEGLEQFDQVVLIHAQYVGDHTRGLFEAEASVTTSTLHPVHDVAIARVHRSSLDLGETDPVRTHRFDHRDGGSVLSEMHAYTEEDAPGLLVLHRHED